MFYVYILRSKKDKKLYTGCTSNLKERVDLHNSGKVSATYGRSPLELIYYEAFINKHDAFEREKWLKTGWGRSRVQKMLKNYFQSLGGQVR